MTKVSKIPKKKKNVKKNPPEISLLTKIALKSLKRPKQLAVALGFWKEKIGF